ncbi:HlyD family secretion protein [Pseudomaricurvus sp. HS19]|uniref:HlyD family secretion protein n=1 Tax=Pseudomaricurvus sp. HS19 TaxID=2692626 RepID=UPI00136F428F|nr:HlyD family secretion protein [Pseudomaricurvus sp. HS19]MYM63500.1 HlyD family efflux transporter periplasmic adaptor subunit [Pseudomaricurvus sp. HS19]
MTADAAKQKLVLLVSVVVLLLGALAAHWFFVSRHLQSTDNAYVEADMAVLAPKITGYVVEVLVQDNEPVVAGQPLLKIEDSDYRARVAYAEAALGAQVAALQTLESEIRLQQSVIRQVQAEQTSARAEQQRAGSDRSRFTELGRSGAASRQQLDDAVAKAVQADAALVAAEARLAAEQGRLSVFRDRRLELQAALAEAEATRQLAQIDLENTVLRAPVAGVLGNKRVQVGQLLQPGVQVMTVVPLAEVYVTANFKETQVSSMQPGQRVALEVDALAGEPLQGYIDSFSPAAGSRFSLLPPENATGNFTKIVQRIPVRIRVQNLAELQGRLRPGMSVVARVDTRSGSERLVLAEPVELPGPAAPAQARLGF